MQDIAQILIIGGGQMGGALARGFRASGIGAQAITLVEHSEEKRNAFAGEGFSVAPALDALAASYLPDVTLLAIKPQGFDALAPALSAFYHARPAHLFLSILAGTTLARLASALGGEAPIVRVMPNTPALIGEGVSACIASAQVRGEDRVRVGTLLSSVGKVVWLGDESQLDVATAISGSGPAYMFHVLECLIEAGIARGLPEDIARDLAIATMRGSAGLALGSPAPLAALRRNVTSPGGTTEAALSILMPTLPGLFLDAVDAAIARAKALA